VIDLLVLPALEERLHGTWELMTSHFIHVSLRAGDAIHPVLLGRVWLVRPLISN
jgi:hypothetical protein